MGGNCYSNIKVDGESQGIDIVQKIHQFIKSNNFYYMSAGKIVEHAEEAKRIQSDEDLDEFLYNILDQKEILNLLVKTVKKIMQLMNVSVRIKSISDEDLPVIIIEVLFLFLSDPERTEIQNEKLNIIKLLLDTENSDEKDKGQGKFIINAKKFQNNIKLFVNIVHLILISYILLIIFLPSGANGLDSYFENQERQGLGIDDTIKWVYKIIESIINEQLDKDKIIENCIRFIEIPIKESIYSLIKLSNYE